MRLLTCRPATINRSYAAYLSFSSSYEGLGLPVLESLACGTQEVVGALNGSLTEAGGDFVDYVDDMDANVIASKMLGYDDIAKEAILNSATIEEHLKLFSCEQCACRYVELYVTLL